MQLMIGYTGSSRKCRHLITALIKSKSCQRVTKINYVQSFVENTEGKIDKKQELLLMLHDITDKKKVDRLLQKHK